MLGAGEGGAITKQNLIEALVDSLTGHTIIYTLTIKEARTIMPRSSSTSATASAIACGYSMAS